LTHVARNADSHVWRAQAAIRGEVVDQYEGGMTGRDAVIEQGAARPAGEIVEDVGASARALDEMWPTLPADAWTVRSRDAKGRERPLFELPSRRWQELEVHVIDIDVGVTHRDWPNDFVFEWLPRTRERMWGQLPAGVVAPDDPRDELAWFYGRLRGDGLPELPAWG
jgi:maleylpyruvate isomerase